MSRTDGLSCDGCTACCFTHANRHFKKPVAKLCDQCKLGEGCKVYAERPEECSGYSCLWLEKDFPEALRPDRIGMVAELREPIRIGDKIIATAQLWELWPGALQGPRAQVWVEMLKENKYIFTMRALKPEGGYRDTVTVPPGLFSPGQLRLLAERFKFDLDIEDLVVTE